MNRKTSKLVCPFAATLRVPNNPRNKRYIQNRSSLFSDLLGKKRFSNAGMITIQAMFTESQRILAVGQVKKAKTEISQINGAVFAGTIASPGWRGEMVLTLLLSKYFIGGFGDVLSKYAV